MCSCLLLLLHVYGVHNSKFDINIGHSVGVACASVVAKKRSVNGRIGDLRLIENIFCIECMRMCYENENVLEYVSEC